jgi:cytochrome P450
MLLTRSILFVSMAGQDMFIGGTDTIYKAIEWTMAELVKNPREMEKVQAEVRRVAGAQACTKGVQHGRHAPTYAAMQT